MYHRSQQSYSRPSFGNRHGNNRTGGFGRRQKYIDPALFVQKAVEATSETYTPVNHFIDFPLVDQLKKNIAQRGYTIPTPIQDQAIPHLLQGKDVVGIANTGTGKTAAFLVPLINKVFLNRSQKTLIIAPTRELAVQIYDELRNLSQGMSIFGALCIGGVPMGGQIYQLRRNPHFVIGTPGRLKDLEQQRILNLSQYNSIVLDEVDRMLDMGFIDDVKYLISRLPSPRHSLFFSATIASRLSDLMHSFLKDPVTISVKSRDTATNVDQDVVRMNGKQKIEVLHDLLIQDDFRKVLIFGRTKWGMERLAKSLDDRGFKVASIHGNKSQNQRQRALSQFKDDHVQILLATDIASRGLDIPDVTHVINYEVPESYEDYIHRIGRTGRADKKGIALTFLDR